MVHAVVYAHSVPQNIRKLTLFVTLPLRQRYIDKRIFFMILAFLDVSISHDAGDDIVRQEIIQDCGQVPHGPVPCQNT